MKMERKSFMWMGKYVIRYLAMMKMDIIIVEKSMIGMAIRKDQMEKLITRIRKKEISTFLKVSLTGGKMITITRGKNLLKLKKC